jgi:YidC/Oxa1 family membrane protein insertase
MSAVDDRLEQVLDYGFWSSLSKIILKILNFLYGYVKNYGLAIILFTLLFQLLLMPLSISSQKSIEKQADLNRKIQYLKQKYRNDSERLQQEQAELLRTHGVGGLMGGCLLVLVQAPIFLALSRLLSNCFELYNERFLWIPDLASYDPFYILPLLFFIAMLARTYTQDKPIRQQLSMYALTLFFAAMMARLSAGLVLYIFTGVLVNVIQVYLMKFKRA